MRDVLMAFMVAVAVAVPCEMAAANEGSPTHAAIERGLAFLARDAVVWRDTHNCASCHHAALVVWSMSEAQERGHPVDESVLSEMSKWLANSGDGKTGVPRPEDVPRAFNEKAVSFALGLNAVREPDDAMRTGLKRLLGTVIEDQLENGSWASWPETRPPMFGHSNERATASALLALMPTAAAGDEAARAALDKGLAWLAATPTDDDPQSIALRLVLLSRLGRAADEYAPLVTRIRQRQRPDGGWSQTADLPSDGWATGQALYALAHARHDADDQTIARGQAYLVSAQREDGSWPMISRPTKPGGAGSESLVPIVGAGSSWAVLGLMRTATTAPQ